MSFLSDRGYSEPLDPLGHYIDLFIPGDAQSKRIGFTDTNEKQAFWDAIIARNGYTEDHKQVLWMASHNLYSKPYYWVNRDLSLPYAELAEPEQAEAIPDIKGRVRSVSGRKRVKY